MARFTREAKMTRAILLAVAACALAGQQPVPGPPWKTSWPEARKEALAAGRPVFIYFTKTS